MKAYPLPYAFVLLFCYACVQEPSAFEKFVQQHASVEQYDVLIKNGNVLDGSGAEAYQADVLVKADSIAFIGDRKSVV